MADGRDDGRISDIMRSEGRDKYRLLARRGVPTFLLLDGEHADGPAPSTRTDGRALAARAGKIYRQMPPAEREAWPGGIALALQTLADDAFFPPVTAPGDANADHDEVFRALAAGRYARVVNFHATPRKLSGQVERQLSRLARNFAPVSHEDLKNLADGEAWPHERPGVILNFFDGFRDNFDVAAPILDRLGLTGWFFLISGWISTPPEDQRAFANDRLGGLPYDEHEIPADDRLALSPEEVFALADRGHVIASHTRTHPVTPDDLTPAALAQETAGSKEELASISGAPVRALAWHEGMSLGVNPPADAALRDAGYDLLFANHAVQRVR